MIRIFFILLLLAVNINAVAQALNALEKKEISITDRDGIKTDYVRVIIDGDSLYIIRDYYKSNQKIGRIGFSKTIPEGTGYKRTGIYTEYYENGNIKERAHFDNDEYAGGRSEFFATGKLYKRSNYIRNEIIVSEVWSENGRQLVKDGFGMSKEWSAWHDAIEEGPYKNGLRDSIWTGCYKNGSLCYREEYQNGKLLTGSSIDPGGKKHTYGEIFELPEFKGGMGKYSEFLSKNLHYPELAITNNIQGKVYVKFTLEKDGSISDAYVMKGVHPLLDKEALRAVKKTGGKWESAKNRAIPVRIMFVTPIVFMLD